MKAPIFIVCAASSGSTLLSSLLDKHQEIALGPELFLFNKKQIYNNDYNQVKKVIRRGFKKGLITEGQVYQRAFLFNLNAYFYDKKSIFQILERSSSLKEFVDVFFDFYLEKRGKTIWGDKTGSNSYFLEEILKLYPNAAIIHLCRDPLDSIRSINKRGGSIFHAVSHYLYNSAAALRYSQRDNYLRVRYEDLVHEPQKTLRDIFDHLGIPFSEEIFVGHTNYYWNEQVDVQANYHQSWGAKPTDKISTDSIGKGHNELDQKTINLIQSIQLSKTGKKMLGFSADLNVDYNYILLKMAYNTISMGEIVNINKMVYQDLFLKSFNAKYDFFKVKKLFESK